MWCVTATFFVLEKASEWLNWDKKDISIPGWVDTSPCLQYNVFFYFNKNTFSSHHRQGLFWKPSLLMHLKVLCFFLARSSCWWWSLAGVQPFTRQEVIIRLLSSHNEFSNNHTFSRILILTFVNFKNLAQHAKCLFCSSFFPFISSCSFYPPPLQPPHLSNPKGKPKADSFVCVLH